MWRFAHYTKDSITRRDMWPSSELVAKPRNGTLALNRVESHSFAREYARFLLSGIMNKLVTRPFIRVSNVHGRSLIESRRDSS